MRSVIVVLVLAGCTGGPVLPGGGVDAGAPDAAEDLAGCDAGSPPNRTCLPMGTLCRRVNDGGETCYNTDVRAELRDSFGGILAIQHAPPNSGSEVVCMDNEMFAAVLYVPADGGAMFDRGYINAGFGSCQAVGGDVQRSAIYRWDDSTIEAAAHIFVDQTRPCAPPAAMDCQGEGGGLFSVHHLRFRLPL